MAERTIPQLIPFLGEEEAQAVVETVRSKWITEGPKTQLFQKRLNRLMDASYSVFAPNGTLALYMGLVALGIGQGDEVLVPDTSFIASATSVMMAGATPVFVGVNDRNFQIDIRSCTLEMTAATRAVMPVHLFGMAAPMDEVMAFATKHHLLVIEDAAQAVGVHYKGRHAGTFGDVGCFSFFADKTITCGEGGFVVCKRRPIYETLLELRNQGRPERGTYIHPSIGYNFRITDLQAAVGLAQLAKLDEIIERKLKVLEWYKGFLKDVSQVRFLEVEEGSEYVPFRVVVMCERAHALMKYLESVGVQTRAFFYPLHRQPCFERFDSWFNEFPNAEYGYEHGICLPVYPDLKRGQVEYICSHIWLFHSAGEWDGE